MSRDVSRLQRIKARTWLDGFSVGLLLGLIVGLLVVALLIDVGR